MTGIVNTLSFIEHNWSNIVLIAAILFVLCKKIASFLSLSKEEKVEAAYAVIREQLLKYMCEAEINWKDYKKSGLLKKSEVITKIYTQFPILKDYISQEDLIADLTEMIDSCMEDMNTIINGMNKEETTQTENEEVVME